jgi:glycosyltransferase involved in cell wall biosynthesis
LAIVANDAGLARQSSLADPFAVQVIPNGVDCGMFVPGAASGNPGGRTTVLFVGRFHQQKNLPFLLEQMARLHKAAPNSWRLVLVGDGEERDSVEIIIRSLNLGSITTLHGWQNDKAALVVLYQQADVVVNPSVYEGMPNVVLEAMACGLPVVASRVPGNDSLVIPRETGLLFTLGDGNAFCAALQELRDNPSLARALGEAGRRRAEAGFSWDQVARAYALFFCPGGTP